ncbi:hypothetical protein [Pseudomonas sp. TWI929]|uniref:hypothetical protein n=1 Tax=Pseudomonas sp. TWI929 TaxID=3136795 RepID=UPI003209B8FD
MSNALNLGSVTLPGDGYLNLFGLQIPVTLGLEGAFLYGDGVADGAKNYAPGKNDAIVRGVPVFSTNFVKMGGGAYYETDIQETAAQTLIVVGRRAVGVPAGSAAHFIDTLSSPTVGSRLFQSTDTALNSRAAKGGDADSIALGTGVAGNMHILCARTSSASLHVLDDRSVGGSVTSTISGARAVSSVPYRIGNGSAVSSAEILLAMIYSRVLSGTELDSVAAWARGYASSKGLTV